MSADTFAYMRDADADRRVVLPAPLMVIVAGSLLCAAILGLCTGTNLSGCTVLFCAMLQLALTSALACVGVLLCAMLQLALTSALAPAVPKA